ncbi:MAG: TlpA family protein disulfide reductase [Candidatus Eremiobacteraeota bacterium]|nr:TlpA family protein disulfide reductase [Candidatus Eremiobacteraeota bacterium]
MISATAPSVPRALAVLVLALCVVTPAPSPARRHEPSTGLTALRFAQPPPDFTYDVGSGARRLDELTGKPVVLNFWASWCEPCRAELDAFVSLRSTYGDAVSLITLSYEDPGVARAFLESRHVALPVVEDPRHAIFDRYSITALPVTVVLARDGTVTHVSVGELDWLELRGAVDAALAPTPDTSPSGRLTLHGRSDTLAGNAGTQSP